MMHPPFGRPHSVWPSDTPQGGRTQRPGEARSAGASEQAWLRSPVQAGSPEWRVARSAVDR